MHPRIRARACAPLVLLAALAAPTRSALADASYQQIPFVQDWSNTAMIQVDDDWSQVPGVLGIFGQTPLTGQADLDPRTLIFYEGLSDTVFANRTDPNTDTSAGIAEFDGLPDPVVAFQTSYWFGILYLQFHVSTTGYRDIRVSYRLRDIDGSSRDSREQFVLQYRIDSGGMWKNVDGTYVTDATTGPRLAGFETSVQAMLPVVCDNLARLQLRVMTTNARSVSDEWVGVDDFTVTGTPLDSGDMGVNLGWSTCATTAATASRAFACDGNGSGFTLVGSFRTDYDVPDFVGVSAYVSVTSAAGTLPDWFAFGTGGCREGALSLMETGPIAGCLNPYLPAEQGGGLVVQPGASPAQLRIWIDWARDLPAPISAATRYLAFVLSMGTASAIDDGAGMCDGCQARACFTLDSVEIYSLSQGLVRILQTPDERNWAAWQGGIGSCPGGVATPARRASWGALKALYR